MSNNKILKKVFRFEMMKNGKRKKVGLEELRLADETLADSLLEEVPPLKEDGEIWFTVPGMKKYFPAIFQTTQSLEELGWSVFFYVRELSKESVKSSSYKDELYIIWDTPRKKNSPILLT